MPAAICLRGVQKSVFIFLLVATALGVSIVVVIVIVLLDLGRPCVVLAIVAAHVVGVHFFGFVGEDAFFEELEHIVAGDGGRHAKEEAAIVVSIARPQGVVKDGIQDQDSNTNRPLAEIAFRSVTIFESGAITVIVADFLLLGTFLDAFRVPRRDRYESCEP